MPQRTPMLVRARAHVAAAGMRGRVAVMPPDAEAGLDGVSVLDTSDRHWVVERGTAS